MFRSSIFRAWLAVSLVVAAAPLSLPSAYADGPNIEGTYLLVSRTLPDGTLQKPPAINGLMSYSRQHRNLNVMWTDADGTPRSYSLVSTYKLTSSEYTETLLYTLYNRPPESTGPVYGLEPKTATVPVQLTGRRVQFKFPFDLPTALFEADRLTATAPGAFIDVWQKVR